MCFPVRMDAALVLSTTLVPGIALALARSIRPGTLPVARSPFVPVSSARRTVWGGGGLSPLIGIVPSAGMRHYEQNDLRS